MSTQDEQELAQALFRTLFDAGVSFNSSDLIPRLTATVRALGYEKREPARAVGEAWSDYYRPGMSSDEAQAFKAGFAAAEREPVVVDDATRLRVAIEQARERHRVWGTPEDPDGLKVTPGDFSKMHRQVMDILDRAAASSLGAQDAISRVERALHAAECGCAYDGEHSGDEIQRRANLARAAVAALTPDGQGEAHLRGRWSNGDPVHIITDGVDRWIAPNHNGATWIPEGQ